MQEVGASLCDAVLQFSISENLIRDYSTIPTSIKIKKDKKSDTEKLFDIDNGRKGGEKIDEVDAIHSERNKIYSKSNVDVVNNSIQNEKEVDHVISQIENSTTVLKKERTPSLFFSPPVCVGDMGTEINVAVQRNILSDIRICEFIVFFFSFSFFSLFISFFSKFFIFLSTPFVSFNYLIFIHAFYVLLFLFLHFFS